MSSDTVFTCSYSNVTDTVTVTVPAQKLQTTITENYLDTDFGLDWGVNLKDENNNVLTGKTVKFYLDNVLKSTQTTIGTGAIWYDDSVMGTHTIKVVFEGDEDYEPSQLEKTVTIGF